MGTVCVYESSNYINTLSVKEFLASSDIETHIPNEHLKNVMPLSNVFRLFAKEDEAESALDILLAYSFIIEEAADTAILNGQKINNLEINSWHENQSENVIKRNSGHLLRIAMVILAFLIMGPLRGMSNTPSQVVVTSGNNGRREIKIVQKKRRRK